MIRKHEKFTSNVVSESWQEHKIKRGKKFLRDYILIASKNQFYSGVIKY